MFGARPLQRAIQKYVEDPLAEFILSENPPEGTAMTAKMNEAKDGLVINYAEKKKGKESDSPLKG